MMEDEEFRLDFARKSYDEVLDATKHQDDKIGRFLTAIAFLFTGAIAFGARSDVLADRVAIGGGRQALPAIFLGLFLALAILTVLLLLVALGPNLNLPSPESEGGPSSRLFFFSMARSTAQSWWDTEWKDNPPSVGDAIKNYVDDAHNLAIKTSFKYGRTNEARAVFSLALLFLVLSVTLGFEAAARAPANAEYTLPWDLTTRGIVAGITALFAFVLAYDFLRLDQTPSRYVNLVDRVFGIWPLYIILFSVPAFVLLCVLPSRSDPLSFSQWTCIGLCLLSTGALMQRFKSSHVTSLQAWRALRRVRNTLGIVGVASAGVVWWIFAKGSQIDRLVLALVAAGLLETPRLSVSFWSWRRHMAELDG